MRDTSGRGNDGIINSSVTYDSTSKNFDFAGDNDWIESPALGWTGAQQHSVSVWIKLDVMSNPNSSSIQNAWTIRKPDSTDAVSRISELHIFSNGTIEWAWHSNNNTTVINKISAGQYYHIVCVYNGGAGNVAASRRMWINGIEETFATVSSTASAINFYDTATFAAGYDQGLNNYDLDGKMSSIKLYDCALTAEEVKTLYDMGRNGSVANPQPLHVAAPLYAPGTIVQVEQSIKRNDSSTTSTSVSDIPGLSVTIHPKFGASKILVSYQINMGGNYHMFLRVKRTQNGATTYVGNGNASGNRPLASSYQSHLHQAHVNSMNMEILDPANGMYPITYQVQFWVAHTNYTAWINRGTDNYNNEYGPGALSSSITVKEVCQ